MKCSSPGSSPCEKTTTPLLCQKSRKKWLSSSKLLARSILRRLANGFCCGITGNLRRKTGLFARLVPREIT